MEGTTIVDRGTSLCSLEIFDKNPTIFEDATKEPCLLNNPLVAGNFGLKFYAGAPLSSNDGINIGTVCIVDKEPRKISFDEVQLLSRLANEVMEELEYRKAWGEIPLAYSTGGRFIFRRFNVLVRNKIRVEFLRSFLSACFYFEIR